jgi:hypothetical protein
MSITFYSMAKNDSKDLPGGDPVAENTSFISSWKWEAGSADSTYNDFFQETSDGNISVGPKSQKSGIEIFTTVLGYILPLVIVGVLVGAFHVYIQKWGGATAIKENYNFLCPYLNYSISNEGDDYSCDTLVAIDASYSKKRSDLEENIMTQLSEYIPVKLTKNILLSSPERKFAIDTYKKKIRMDEILEKFEEVRTNSKSVAINTNNIICNGISIIGDGNVTTQCTVYGWASWNDDENGKLGSARIEVLRFVSNLADTSKSQFILLNPPTSLSMEKVANEKGFDGFETFTTISVQAKYVPFNNLEKQ